MSPVGVLGRAKEQPGRRLLDGVEVRGQVQGPWRLC